MRSMMKVAAALMLGSAMFVSRAGAAEEKPKAESAKVESAKPAAGETKSAGDAKPAAEGKPIKLVKPWSDLTSLTDDQKAKIKAIHDKALAEINVIEKKEKDDITAVLTDAQKAELKDLAAARRKEAAGAKVEKKDDKKVEEKK